MAIKASTNTQRTVVPPTGTGSVWFLNEGTPYVGLQITKLDAGSTTQFIELYHSNYSTAEIPGAGDPSPMQAVTSSLYPYVWAGPDPGFSGSLFTSSAPASQFYNVGNATSKFLNLRFGSIQGGSFIVSMTRKD